METSTLWSGLLISKPTEPDDVTHLTNLSLFFVRVPVLSKEECVIGIQQHDF